MAYSRVIEIDSRHKEAKARIKIINQHTPQQRTALIGNLQMLHPVFNVPNTIQILKKFKLSADTEAEDSSPQEAQDQQNFQKMNQQLNQIVQNNINQSSGGNAYGQQQEAADFDRQSNIQILQQRNQQNYQQVQQFDQPQQLQIL